MWMHAVGIRRSHFYILENQKPLSLWVAMCGVLHPKNVLVPEANAAYHCTMCVRAREKEFGLFA